MGAYRQQWRIVLCDAGEEPRKVSQVWLCWNYYHTVVLVRTLLSLGLIVTSRYAIPLSHTNDDPAWNRAEAVRERLNCPLSTTRVLQLEYRDGADCPSHLFMVPRPRGICWRCGQRLEGTARIHCPSCREEHQRSYNTWWRASKRAMKSRGGFRAMNEPAVPTTTPAAGC